MSEDVRVELEDNVATILIDRPGTSNSLDIDLARQLLTAIAEVAGDPGSRCLLLRSTGDRFCVGGDVRGFAKAGNEADHYIAELAGTMHRAILALVRMEKPTVCLVQGPVAGAGVGLALSADFVVAAPTAHFTAAYSAIGLTPDCGLTWLLPRLIGHRKAMEMIIENRRVVAAEAVAIGLINRVSERLEEDGLELARRLAGGATGAFASSRRLLHESAETSLERQLDRELAAISAASIAGEGKEGIAAFITRRSPDFRRI